MAIKLYYHKTTFQLITIDDGGESLIVGDDGSKVFEFYFGTGTALVDFVLDTTIPLTYEGRVIFKRADGDETNEVYLTPIAGGFYRYVIGDWVTAVAGDLKITTRLKLGAVVTNFGIATIPVEDGVAPDDGSTVSQLQYDALMGAVNEVIIGVTPIAYDNSTSGLAAVDVQGAIDEVDADVDALTVRVTTAESDIDAVEGRATVLETFKNTTVPATYETISNVDLVKDRVEDLETFQEVTVPATYETKADAISKLFLKVDKTTEIANVAIGEGISLETLKTSIGLATTSLSGLMSSTDKGYLNELYALLDTDDVDVLVNTLGEILALFENYPEGVDLVTALAGKVDKVLTAYDTLTGESVVGTEFIYVDAGGTAKKMTLAELFEASNSSPSAFAPNGVYEDLTSGYAIKSQSGIDIDEEFTEIDGRLDNIVDGTQDITFDNTISELTATTVKGAIDELEANIDDLETSKQDKLVAGDNITIDPITNVISASGGEVDLNEMAYFDYAGSIYGSKYSLLASAWEHSLTVDPSEIERSSTISTQYGSLQYPNGEDNGVIIPNSVTRIGYEAFSGWSSNNQPLVIPNSVTSISGYTFRNWTSNNQPLVIPNSVTSIGGQAFYGWSSNNQPLVIGNSVTSIGTNAFYNWTANNHPLVIPNSVTSIGNYAFSDWTSVPYIEIQAITPPTLGGANAFSNQNNAPIYVPDESVAAYKAATNWVSLASRIFAISEKDTKLDDYYNKDEVDGLLGAKVNANNPITAGTKTKITYDSKGLVTGGSDLVETDIPPLAPSKITQDENNRFVSDTEKSTWNEKQEALGFTPENQANKKTTLTNSDVDFPTTKAVKTAIDTAISQTLKPMGNWNASTNTPTLLATDINRANQVWYVEVAGTRFDITFDVGDELVYNTNGVIFKRDNVDAVISVNGKEGVVVLTQDDVADGSTYERVTNTEKTTWNGKQNALTAGDGISISGNVISATGIDLNEIGYMNFAGSIYGDKYSLLASAWEHSLTVDPSEIERSSTISTQYGSLQYPNGETEGVIIPQGVTRIGSYAFRNSINNQPLVIPNSVTSIGSGAFDRWTSNNHPLIIPNSVTSISGNAFSYWSTNNQPLVIPNSVTSIGSSAFERWTVNDKPLVIPNSVTSIGSSVFYYWNNVPYIEMKRATPPTLVNANAFDGQGNAPIYVPDASVNTYKTATNWVNLASRIFPISDLNNSYSKEEIDNMIGDIESVLDTILGV